MSASVKAYFALKLIGDSIDAEHMRRAREAIRAHGGAARANVFTRTGLALYGAISWRAVPVMPVEVMLLPKWFPFHIMKIAYWSRTVIVPLLVLLAFKPRARNPKGVRIDELFLEPPEQARLTPRAPHQNRWWFAFFRGVDMLLRVHRALDPEAHAQARDRPRRWRSRSSTSTARTASARSFPAMVNNVRDVRHARLSGGSPAPRHRAPVRSRSCWSSATTRPTASPAIRRSGTPASSVMRCSRSAASARSRRSTRASTGSRPSRSSTSRATGRRAARTCGPAAGRSSTTIRTIPTSTTPRWSRWRWTGRRTCRAATTTASRSRARANGSSACRARTAAGARSMPTTPTLPQPHPVRRPRRAARPPTEDVSARCVSMLAQLGDMPDKNAKRRRGHRLSARDAASRRQLVRPLGHELHLRHLVGAVPRSTPPASITRRPRSARR